MIADAAVAITFAFSRSGGNIVPFHARIAASGDVIVDSKPRRALKRPQLAALERLVQQQRFAALPSRIRCAGVLPDIATRSVTAVVNGKRSSVSVRGGCNRRFDRVYGALVRAIGLQ